MCLERRREGGGPGGRFSSRPTDGSVPSGTRGWALGWKNVSRNARATSRVIASARRRRDRSRCRARTLRRRARLERVTSSALATERDRDPRETKSRPTGIASTRRTNPSKNPSTAWSVKHPACVPCGNARATRATKRIMVVARMVTCAATSARRKHAAEEFRCEVVFVTGGDPSRKGHPRQQRSEPEALMSRRHCDLSDLSEAFPAKKKCFRQTRSLEFMKALAPIT